MARQATTTDAFNAIAETQRRRILGLLAIGESDVSEIVLALGLAQPQVSKHLRVLREVELVSAREEGRRRIYSLNAQKLKPIHTWVSSFERFWDHQLGRIKQRAEARAASKPSTRRSQS